MKGKKFGVLLSTLRLVNSGMNTLGRYINSQVWLKILVREKCVCVCSQSFLFLKLSQTKCLNMQPVVQRGGRGDSCVGV